MNKLGSQPTALVIAGDGINCENETEWALQLAGFKPIRLHDSELLKEPGKLGDCDLCVIPGGFSFGDEIASGKVLGVKLKERLNDALHQFIDRGKLLVGICNGFQVLVQMGLLPESEPGKPRIVSLARNSGRKFQNRWVEMTVSAGADSTFFRGLEEIALPIRHGEGRLVLEPDAIDTMQEHDAAHPAGAGHKKAELVKQRAPLRYANDVNGSFDRIAALVNERGNVMGMMPHPEAFVRWTQHPRWTERKALGKISAHSGDPDGLRIFKNAAEFLGAGKG
jgi:phosphoribosylformylglycinamidine (FGAM) synthase-like amidotransferase family enzyme